MAEKINQHVMELGAPFGVGNDAIEDIKHLVDPHPQTGFFQHFALDGMPEGFAAGRKRAAPAALAGREL
jgi:hypothetical protein